MAAWTCWSVTSVNSKLARLSFESVRPQPATVSARTPAENLPASMNHLLVEGTKERATNIPADLVSWACEPAARKPTRRTGLLARPRIQRQCCDRMPDERRFSDRE